MINLNTIKDSIKYTEIIKKSKFITYLHPVNNEAEIKQLLDKYNQEYHDATHVCYSYILDKDTFKFYDDGEPTNSAGIPIYQVLKNNKLIYVLCVVVRYFGGVKLGVGGLAHAYSSGAINALNEATIVEYTKTYEYIIESNYTVFDNLVYFLNKKGIVILNKQFLDKIFINISCSDQDIESIRDSFPKIDITLVE